MAYVIEATRRLTSDDKQAAIHDIYQFVVEHWTVGEGFNHVPNRLLTLITSPTSMTLPYDQHDP
jgi:hypothetical protein